LSREENMIRTTMLAAIISAIAPESAVAADLGTCSADLSAVQGAVFVNNAAVTEPQPLAAGDRVRVASGFAKIVYCNGAIVELAEGQAVAVLASPPEDSRGWAPVGALPSMDGPTGVHMLAGGGVVAATGLAAVVVNDNPTPVSP
jgi:hypothetical protein